MALSGTLTAALLVSGVPEPIAVPARLLLGAAFGIGNGIFVAYLKMPPIIVTLATMGIGGDSSKPCSRPLLESPMKPMVSTYVDTIVCNARPTTFQRTSYPKPFKA